MKRAVLVLMLVAGDAAAAPGAIYAPLFRPGAHWTYRVSERVEADGTLEVTSTIAACRVGELRAYPAGVMARVDCRTSGGRALPIDGVWLEDARGLWRIGDFPRGAPDLTSADLVIEAVPAPVTIDRGAITRTVEATGDGWCARTEEVMDDAPDSEHEVCFGPRGITWASAGSHAEGDLVELELR